MTNTEIYQASLRLEGERFKLFRRMDNTRSLNDYYKIHDEIKRINKQIDQYGKVLEEFKRMKRKMRK